MKSNCAGKIQDSGIVTETKVPKDNYMDGSPLIRREGDSNVFLCSEAIQRVFWYHSDSILIVFWNSESILVAF